jgi:hypothetical protein
MYDAEEDEVVHPLEDPNYDPVHKPTARKPIPDIISRWNPASQVRWFTRFSDELRAMRLAPIGKHFDWSPWYVSSVEHKGWCCGSCQGSDEGEWWDGPECCHRSTLHSARLARRGLDGMWKPTLPTLRSQIPHLRCENAPTTLVEGYSPRETYHGSLDRWVYTCDQHADLARRKWLRGLNPFSRPLGSEPCYQRCGTITDFEGIKP